MKEKIPHPSPSAAPCQTSKRRQPFEEEAGRGGQVGVLHPSSFAISAAPPLAAQTSRCRSALAVSSIHFARAMARATAWA